MRRLIFGFVLITGLALSTASRAKADSMDSFTYTFAGNVFTWQLDSSPTPNASFPSNSFYLDDVTYYENGVQQAPQMFAFYDTNQNGGFAVPPGIGSIMNTFGAVLFSGGDVTPTFLPGTYDLANGSTTGPLGTLMITGPGAATPEPASLLLLATGLVGFGIVRRKVAK